MKISFVIPCFNSSKTIRTVVEGIIDKMNEIQSEYEVILVNDGSTDATWNVINEICIDPKVLGINLLRNFGQHAALMAGYNSADGDIIVTLDDDGQTPVDELEKMMIKLDEGYDVVYAKYVDRKDSTYRKIGTLINNYMLETLVGKPKSVHLTSFFVARRQIINEICLYKQGFPYIWGLVLRTTKNIGNATLKHEERNEGRSGYTLSKLISLWMNGFTAFSVKPLRVSFGIGAFSSFIGLIGIVFTIVNKIINPEIAAGYSSLMAVVLIVGGLTLLSIGLIGEYVGRIYMCINATPQYIIRETINGKND